MTKAPSTGGGRKARADAQREARAAAMAAEERPYKCHYPDCNKSYKNPGGIKYHLQHGHCEDTGDPELNEVLHKPYQCTVAGCAKRYKNLNGLKYHIEHAHLDLLPAAGEQRQGAIRAAVKGPAAPRRPA